MPAKHSARGIALAALCRSEKEGESMERCLNRSDSLLSDPRDRAFSRQLVYGVLENRRLLDTLLDDASKFPMKKQKLRVRNLLRMGAYELFFLHTPSHAAINETVTLAHAAAKAQKNFINAVLRALWRKEEAIQLLLSDTSSLPPAVRYSLPDWMADYLATCFAPASWESVLRLQNQPAPISLFVAPSCDRDAVEEELAAILPHVRKGTLSEHCLLCDGGAITETDAFQSGRISIQSQPGVRVAEIAVEGMEKPRILDLCAAPGGKSVAMKLLAPGSSVVSNDAVPEKMRYLRENAARMQAHLELVTGDARQERQEWRGAFDVVLVDAPCSGLGLLGRKPDIRWNRQPADLPALQTLQKEILHTAAQYVKPGGRLVYSTCTYGAMENEDVIASLSDAWSAEAIGDKDVCRYSPLDEQADGFFMARFRRQR